MWSKAAALGTSMAVLAIAGLHWPFEDEALSGMALFLAFTASVYPGALLAQPADRRTAATEIVFAAATFAFAWLGLLHHPLWIAFGYVGHALWDWAHHLDRIPTRTASWFPPACAAFDVIVAIYVVASTTG